MKITQKTDIMKTRIHFTLRTSHLALGLALLSTLNSQFSTYAQGTAFTYQGRLFDNGNPANGNYNLRLTLYDGNVTGNVVSGPLTNAPVTVSNGLFTVMLDFGSNAFTGPARWLQIDASTNSASPLYTPLIPRQQLTPAPYAIYAETSGSANTVVGGGGAGWSLTGNDGSAAFLGTTNNYPLRLFVNNLGAADFWPYANGNVSVALGTYSAFSVLGNGGDFIAAGGYSGAPNVIYTDYSSIGGGYDNRINLYSPESVIAGGSGHRITGSSGTIGGGGYNTISNASVGTIPGGANNLVSGDYGFAAGHSAQVLHSGAFVWADNSGSSFASTSNNQFSVRANGGVRFVTGGAGMTIDGVQVGAGGGGGGSNASYTISTVQTLNSGLDSSAMGYQNTASGNYATVAGGIGNTASGIASFVGGGGSDGSTIAGNTASGPASTVAGGLGNSAFYYATVGGGQNNNAGGYYSAVGGGYGNNASQSDAWVGGGSANTASGDASMVPGGLGNTASGAYSFAAGDSAMAVNNGAFVWSDSSSGTPFSSTANNQFSARALGGVRFVTGGNGTTGLTLDGYQVLTTASGGGGGGGGITNAWLLTGNYNANPALGYFLGTSDTNALELRVNGQRGLRLEPGLGFNHLPNVIGGSSANSVAANHFAAAIGGGSLNTISANYATVSGGSGNTNSGDYATVGGGIGNTAGGIGSFVGGGGYDGTNTGGNIASGNAATVGGGFGNQAIGPYSTVPGGYANTAGYGATVPGGYANSATGNGSFAAGRNASTPYDGNFVWGDGTRPAVGSGANEFDVLATGGVNFFTGLSSEISITSSGNIMTSSGNVMFGAQPRQMIDLYKNGANDYGIGVQAYTLYQRAGTSGGFAWYSGGVHNNSQTNSGGGTTLMTLDSTGNLNVTANASVCTLTIRGGCDLAEPFQISSANQEIPEGAVVVIDEENPGHLKLSEQPYDARVAGIVSGANGINPGIQMHQQGLLEGGKNVALTGRVYVQADASNGPIKPGDLLTSSTIPGHAMKVSDHAKAQGAILGKAMTGLREGQGMVLVLVTLQ